MVPLSVFHLSLSLRGPSLSFSTVRLSQTPSLVPLGRVGTQSPHLTSLSLPSSMQTNRPSIGYIWLPLDLPYELRVQVEWAKAVESSLSGDASTSEQQGARKFMPENLPQATKNFNESNLIGEGRFGLIYKGLLHDGNLVTIKRCKRPPQQKFIEELFGVAAETSNS